MALKTSWDAVPSLFVRLAESEMIVSRFSLRKEGGGIIDDAATGAPGE
ncbi:membrane protein [Salmonella enterica subsp. enterica]|uniref:Membrane protein n=1 Tax=Salmonella enterica I TaxID=59201 RepID=A0A379VJA8_SALET|nr:membrane protein [Salmonella enterica subsp. enterica]